MKQLFYLFPLFVFFIGLKTYDLFIATKLLILTMALVLAFCWFKYHTVNKMELISFILVVIFGSLTIYLQDQRFLIWKVTIFNGLLALMLLVAPYFIKQTLLERILGKELTLPAKIWQHLNWIWIAFFVLLALTNLYIGFSMSITTWGAFKSFGAPLASVIVTVICGVYVYPFLQKEEKPKMDE